MAENDAELLDALEDALDAVLEAQHGDTMDQYRLGGLAGELAAEALRVFRAQTGRGAGSR